MFLGKTDNRVKPSPGEGGTNPVSSSSNSGRNAGTSRRPAAPATVGAGKPTHQITRSVKAVKNFFQHPVRGRDIAVMRDIGQTTAEIWVTFIFTVLVGCFFAGGGLYLVWLGSKNNVVDFVVVGGMGTLIGICLTAVGMFLFCKPLCIAHQKRREERLQEKQQAMVQAEYVSKAKAKLLTMQIADALTNRRPSHVELYGQEDEVNSLQAAKAGGSRQLSASSSATVYDLPPPVALPNRAKEKNGQESKNPPVILMRESSADDRLAIANAAQRKDAVRRAMLRAQDKGEISLKTDDDDSTQHQTTVSDIETATFPLELDVGIPESNTQPSGDHLVCNDQQEVKPFSSNREELSKPLQDEHTNSDEDTTAIPQITHINEISGSVSLTLDVAHEEKDNYSVERRRSVLSAANDRRKSSLPEVNAEEDDDEIEVVPH